MATFQLQRCSRGDLFSHECTVLTCNLSLACEQFFLLNNKRLDRLEELTPDPAGAGIVASMRNSMRLAAIGSALILGASLPGTRASITGLPIVPPELQYYESWFRSTCPKATIDFSNLESLLTECINEHRPYVYTRPWSAEIVWVMGLNGDKPTNPIEATTAFTEHLLRFKEVTAAGVGDYTAAAATVPAALAAYRRFVHFISSTLRLPPLAASLTGTSSGHLLSQIVKIGATFNIVANCDTSSWNATDYAWVVIMKGFIDAQGYTELDAAWQDAPASDWNQPRNLLRQFVLQMRGSEPPLECKECALIAGPHLTFWPAPFAMEPVQNLLTGTNTGLEQILTALQPEIPGAAPLGAADGPAPIAREADPNATAGLIPLARLIAANLQHVGQQSADQLEVSRTAGQIAAATQYNTAVAAAKAGATAVAAPVGDVPARVVPVGKAGMPPPPLR